MDECSVGLTFSVVFRGAGAGGGGYLQNYLKLPSVLWVGMFHGEFKVCVFV